MKGSLAHLKLSSIDDHHKDQKTDHLYQPLRAAINAPVSPSHFKISNTQNQNLKQQMKTSQYSMSGNQQTFIKQSTLIPQNMHLIETINPLKRIRARSRRYRAISVEEVIKKPVEDHIFKLSMQLHPAKKKEVVYDYEPNGYEATTQANTDRKISVSTDYKLPARSRSITAIGPIHQNIHNNLAQAEPINMKVHRKVPHSPTSQTSIKINQHSTAMPTAIPSMNTRIKSPKDIKMKEKSPEFSNEYYQDTNKYAFNKQFKTSSRNPAQHLKSTQAPESPYKSPRNNSSNYKYNLFSMLDEQANNNCTSGLCTKNELVASRIKKRW